MADDVESSRARLVATSAPAGAEGVVLVLHGGASRGEGVRVSPTQLSVLRMVPVAQRIARVGRGRLAVVRLLNSTRGWDATPTPVDDVRWALSRLTGRLGGHRPTVLVGHSLGGRAALLAAGEPDVVGAVALNPWVYADDGRRGLPPGRRVLVVHGSADRIAPPARSAAVARDLSRSADVGYVRVDGAQHAMLRHGARFETLAADFAAEVLLGAPPVGALARIAAGERFVEV